MTVQSEAGRARPAVGERRGSVVLTERDQRVLAMVGNHYGATFWVLRHWLSEGDDVLSESGVRQQVARWERAGLVTRASALGRMWVTLSRRGYDFVGQSYALWKMPLSILTHGEMTAAVRIWYESDPGRVERGGPWTTERELFKRRGRFGADAWHVPDGLLEPEEGPATAIEVELHRKQPASRYVSEVFDRLHPDVSSVVYLCPVELLSPLRTSVLWAQESCGLSASVSVRVSPLPVLARQRLERVPR